MSLTSIDVSLDIFSVGGTVLRVTQSDYFFQLRISFFYFDKRIPPSYFLN